MTAVLSKYCQSWTGGNIRIEPEIYPTGTPHITSVGMKIPISATGLSTLFKINLKSFLGFNQIFRCFLSPGIFCEIYLLKQSGSKPSLWSPCHKAEFSRILPLWIPAFAGMRSY